MKISCLRKRKASLIPSLSDCFAGNKSSKSGKMREVKTSKVKTRDFNAPVNKKAQKARKNKTKDWSRNKSKKKKLKKNTIKNQKTINFVG